MSKMTLIQAADAALAKMRAMSDEELMAALDACEGGWISTAIRELNEFGEYIDKHHPELLKPKFEITVEKVKKLREETGLNMMECKKALYVSEGDHDEAVEYLKRSYRCTSYC